jgi:hypothetical protein
MKIGLMGAYMDNTPQHLIVSKVGLISIYRFLLQRLIYIEGKRSVLTFERFWMDESTATFQASGQSGLAASLMRVYLMRLRYSKYLPEPAPHEYPVRASNSSEDGYRTHNEVGIVELGGKTCMLKHREHHDSR